MASTALSMLPCAVITICGRSPPRRGDLANQPPGQIRHQVVNKQIEHALRE
jgi:hypothetical protein